MFHVCSEKKFFLKILTFAYLTRSSKYVKICTIQNFFALQNLDYALVEGSLEDVIDNLEVIKAVEDLGFLLNYSTSEITIHDDSVKGIIITALLGDMVVDLERAFLVA